jgi:O-acetylhomoserine/O-acetylserine sulfhydrylase-like pyridoxal-dependent enzyme
MATPHGRENWHFDTLSVHAGYSPDPTTKAVAVPIYQTVAYAFDSAQHGADLQGGIRGVARESAGQYHRFRTHRRD